MPMGRYSIFAWCPTGNHEAVGSADATAPSSAFCPFEMGEAYYQAKYLGLKLDMLSVFVIKEDRNLLDFLDRGSSGTLVRTEN